MSQPPDLTLLAKILRCGPNAPYAKLLEVAAGAVRRSDYLASLTDGLERLEPGIEGEAHDTGPSAEMHPDPNGRYVRFEDLKVSGGPCSGTLPQRVSEPAAGGSPAL